MPRVLGKILSRVLRTYYLGPDHPMKLRLWSAVRRILGYPRLTIPYVGCGWITVDERDYFQREIFITGSYESEVWEALAAFSNSSEVVWDVGAHIGSFAIQAMLDLRVKEVHAFEPDLINAEILSFNLHLNKGRYYIHQLGLSSSNGIRSLYRGPIENTGLSSLVNTPGLEIFQVECHTADDLVFKKGLTPPTLLKIDVEGWEDHVFHGGKRLLAEIPPKAIAFETSYDKTYGINAPHLVDDLRHFGYDVEWIRRPTGEIQPRENFLAVQRR